MPGGRSWGQDGPGIAGHRAPGCRKATGQARPGRLWWLTSQGGRMSSEAGARLSAAGHALEEQQAAQKRGQAPAPRENTMDRVRTLGSGPRRVPRSLRIPGTHQASLTHLIITLVFPKHTGKLGF